MLEVLTETKISIGYRFRDASCLDAAFGQPQLYSNKCGKSATKPCLLQAATPWFGNVLPGQCFLVVLHENCGSQNARCSIFQSRPKPRTHTQNYLCK